MMESDQPTMRDESKATVNGEAVQRADQDEQKGVKLFKSPITKPMLLPEVCNTYYRVSAPVPNLSVLGDEA